MTTFKYKTRRACLAVALGFVWAWNGAPASAQISPDFASSVQQNLATLRQAENARTSTFVNETRSRPTPKTQVTAREKRSVEALFIAAQNYDGAGGLPSLKSPVNDARLWKTRFDDANKENGAATILCDDAELSPTPPNRQNILEALTDKASKARDLLFVTFSGRGVAYGGESFFCPLDLKGTDFGDVDQTEPRDARRKGRENNLLAVEDVLDVLKNAKAKDVVVVFDLYVDDSDVDLAAFESFRRASDRRTNGGFFVLTSRSTGESAKEITVGGKKYGAFAYYFVEGLGGRADFAGGCDGCVTLNEAYDYARSKTRGQTPELWATPTQAANWPTLARVSLDGFSIGDANAAEIDAWSDQEFLLRSGYVLCNSRWPTNVLRVAEKTLDAALTNAPGDPSALELRGSARRSLGDFEGALSDWERVGMKLQVYVKSLRPADKGFPAGALPPRYQEEWSTISLFNENGEKTGEQAETFDLLTVTKVRKDKDNVEWLYVAEKNNVPLGARAGWAKRDELIWNFSIAANIVNKSKLQPARIGGRSIERYMTSPIYRTNPRPSSRSLPSAPRF